MRIVYLTAGAGRMYCGACLRDGALAAALMAKGHDVLFVPTYTPLKLEGDSVAVDRLFFGGVNVYLQQKFRLFRHTPRFIDRLFDAGALLMFVAGFGHLTAARDLAEMTISVLEGEHGRQQKELDRLIEWLRSQSRPDVVVLPTSLFAGVAGAIRRRIGAPVLTFVSGEDMFIGDFPEPYRARTLEVLRRRARECDGFIATNRYYAGFMADYLAVPPERIHVAVPGIDVRGYPTEPRPLRQRTPGEPFTIGFLARICPQKGLHLLAEAFHLLKQRSETSNCRLRVAGYLGAEFRRYLNDIRGKIRRWGIEDSFEHAGELDHEAKIAFLSGLDAFSVPAAYPEPKGRYVPEALAAGTPVVLPRIGCLPEWVEATGGGIVTEPNDPASLADGLGRLMQDGSLARRLGEAGRATVRARFTIEHMADSALAVFERFHAQ